MMDAAPSFRLRRAQRITQGRDFQRAKAQGGRAVQGCLILNWRENADAKSPRLGVITSRKLGGATVRSRARRLLRESFRLNRHRIERMDVILVARNSIVGKTLAGVEADLLAALKKAGLLKQ